MNERYLKYLSRRKTLTAGVLVTGYYFYSESKDKHYITGDSTDYGEQKEEIDPTTLGSCTGLRDKNGELIFEGDIVTKVIPHRGKTSSHWWRAEIEYSRKKCAFVVRRRAKAGRTTRGYLGHHSNSLEVIGNVYDNPELTED